MYLVFSSFYSHHAMRTMQDEPTGAVFGFISRIESLIQELRPDRLAVAFDAKEKTFRRELYPEYKAKRLLPPEELLQQLPLIREYLDGRGIHSLEKPGLEGDDIIALLARRYAAAGDEVLIFSADKDLFQLVGERDLRLPSQAEKKTGPGRGQGILRRSTRSRSSTTCPGRRRLGQHPRHPGHRRKNRDQADRKIRQPGRPCSGRDLDNKSRASFRKKSAATCTCSSPGASCSISTSIPDRWTSIGAAALRAALRRAPAGALPPAASSAAC